jgi:hypothetical protein
MINIVIEDNLENMYLKQNVNITKEFSTIFKELYFKNLVAKLDYLSNKKVDLDNDYIKKAINHYQHQTYIELLHHNKKTFGVNESIRINVALKNIQKMQVKVFEINTDNYFRKHMSPFTTDISLDGLVPKYEKEYLY